MPGSYNYNIEKFEDPEDCCKTSYEYSTSDEGSIVAVGNDESNEKTINHYEEKSSSKIQVKNVSNIEEAVNSIRTNEFKDLNDNVVKAISSHDDQVLSKSYKSNERQQQPVYQQQKIIQKQQPVNQQQTNVEQEKQPKKFAKPNPQPSQQDDQLNNEKSGKTRVRTRSTSKRPIIQKHMFQMKINQ